MDEIIIENYLDAIQENEIEDLSEGLRDFLAKFNRPTLKNTVDKLHNAFEKGDGQTFETVSRSMAKIGRIPKYKEITGIMKTFQDETPVMDKATELSKKVIKNTFKIRDKAKLEILGNAVALTAYIKSKGGKTDPLKHVKTTLFNINSEITNIYDTGFDKIEAQNAEEERMKETLIKKSKREETLESMIILIVLTTLIGAIVFLGFGVWLVISSKLFLITGGIIVFLVLFLKIAAIAAGLTAAFLIPMRKIAGG